MLITILIFAILFAVDQGSKYLAQLFLTAGTRKTVIPHIFSFDLEYNSGASFSMLSGSDTNWLLIIISGIATLVLIYFCAKNDWKNSKFKSSLLTIILAGCVGNLYDRIIMVIPYFNKESDGRPGVVDMLHFDFLDYIWNALFKSDFASPNIADLYLVFGLIIFAIYIIFFEERMKKKNEAHCF